MLTAAAPWDGFWSRADHAPVSDFHRQSTVERRLCRCVEGASSEDVKKMYMAIRAGDFSAAYDDL